MTELGRGARLSAPLPRSVRPMGRWLRRLAAGTLHLRLPGGESITVTAPAPGPEATWVLHRPLRLIRCLLHRGDLGLAESYIAGDWDSPQTARLLELLNANHSAYNYRLRGRWLTRLTLWLFHRARANTRRGARRNIMAHYDLGNAFYRLWLDPGMTYSGAWYAAPAMDLAQAQDAKYTAILQTLAARPGEHVLEIGCGWGGFAEAAARAGLRVTGVTLSPNQLAWARERIRKAGLEDRVVLRLQDYRALSGQYDHVVSIEMFEAVGEAHWQTWFETVHRCLRPGGRALAQIITIREDAFESYRAHPDFIQRYIFPGGMLPSRSHLRSHARAAGLEVATMAASGTHYARTLADWDARFQAATPALEALGFDLRFRRMWHYYLAYCEAGFRSGHIDLQRLVMQVSPSPPQPRLIAETPC
ncbi:class I SAM-dependent methyltransferase [Alkalilimnicola ehrlichii MLHE-1]|uniref:Cyclopropane-fatty-acyl-phospholipid synthase n=1 Tax=Alkalilimnicola ehrlichii (strain ATCC BAA-1101 / DSM 17681 / MLHE-1) TaxID=187272 RepID=Q0A6E1_ALKEH|nr:cyclopropane-fatty-acyl-phospholipid synthase family protein [Alkalilimnicola ehrlichii]ABI57596.1 cyclopropane-fatty-acyl-phospholipid synthase [Alkalilimnicola ehrlichii MLHE-1]